MDRIERLQNHISPSAASAHRSYRYTVGGGALNFEQREFYEKNGFVVIRNLFSREELDGYIKRFKDICDGRVERSGTMTVMRDIALVKSGILPHGESNITKIQSFELDDELFAYCRHPLILSYVSSFVGPNITSMHTMFINKPPDTGKGSSRHPLHQDLYYFPFRPADRIVCSWTATQTINRANGCLVVLPGSHKTGELRAHGYPEWELSNSLYHGIQDLTEEEMNGRVHLEMEAGDTVFFHPILIHGSGRNSTAGFRKSISSHYASSDCHYVDVTGTIQDSIKKEVEGVARHRGFEIDLQVIWRGRARLAAGRPGLIN